MTPAAAQAPPSGKGKVWTIRDQSDGKSELSIDSELVVVLGYQIPAANITHVMYDQQARSKGAVLADNLAPILWTGYPIGAALIMAPFKTRKHFITMNWSYGREPMEVTFRAEKGDYQAILQELARVTGKPWRDLPAEMKIERDSAPEVSIDRMAEIGDVRLKPGTYKVAIRERPDNSAEAVFYRKGPRPVAQVSVKLVKATQPVKLPQAVYNKTGEGRPDKLVEIVLPERTIQFPAKPSADEGGAPH